MEIKFNVGNIVKFKIKDLNQFIYGKVVSYNDVDGVRKYTVESLTTTLKYYDPEEIRALDYSDYAMYAQQLKNKTTTYISRPRETGKIQWDVFSPALFKNAMIFETKKDPNGIQNVFFNEKEGITVVLFNDGKKIIKHTTNGDNFDINIGVALALAEKLYGSSSKFHKAVKKVAKETKVNKNEKG